MDRTELRLWGRPSVCVEIFVKFGEDLATKLTILLQRGQAGIEGRVLLGGVLDQKAA